MNNLSTLNDIDDSFFSSSYIQDNCLLFIHDMRTYRVRMLTQGEQFLMESKRNTAHLEYISEPGCITRKNLIKKLKDLNILDIEELEKKKDILLKDLKQVWIMLGERGNSNPDLTVTYVDKIKNLKQQIKDIDIEISEALAPCLQSRLEKLYLDNVTLLATEFKVGETWQKLWKDEEAFKAAQIDLVFKASAHVSWLLLNRGF